MGLARRPSLEDGCGVAGDGQGADQPKEDGFEDSLELDDCQEFDNIVRNHVEQKMEKLVPRADQPVSGKVGDQSVQTREQERGSQLVDEDDEDWLGSQLDQESSNDQTLTYCILSELDDTQRLVTRVKQKSEDDNTGRKEDDVVGHGR